MQHFSQIVRVCTLVLFISNVFIPAPTQGNPVEWPLPQQTGEEAEGRQVLLHPPCTRQEE